MPTDEPEFAGFTKQGRPIARSTRSITALGSAASSCAFTAIHGTTGMPAASSRRFETSLSICSAEPSTPAPT